MYENTLNDLVIIGAAALPYLELRGAIPVACSLGLSAPRAYLLAVFGNMLPVLPLMTLIGFVSRWLSRFPMFARFFEHVFRHCEKNKGQILKYGYWGLALFVAIPLPMTGAWSGAVLAFLVGLRKRYAFFAIFAGVIVAGIIVLILTYGIARLF